MSHPSFFILRRQIAKNLRFEPLAALAPAMAEASGVGVVCGCGKRWMRQVVREKEEEEGEQQERRSRRRSRRREVGTWKWSLLARGGWGKKWR